MNNKNSNYNNNSNIDANDSSNLNQNNKFPNNKFSIINNESTNSLFSKLNAHNGIKRSRTMQ